MSTFAYNYPPLKVDSSISSNIINYSSSSPLNIFTVPTGKIAIFSFLKFYSGSGGGSASLIVNGFSIRTLSAGLSTELNNLILGPGSTLEIVSNGINANIMTFGALLKNADI